MIFLQQIENNLLIAAKDYIFKYQSDSCEDNAIHISEPLLLPNQTKGQTEITKTEKEIINSFEVSQDKQLLVISTENKQVIIYDINFKEVKRIVTSRMTSQVKFTSSNDLLVADKTGDVYLYNISFNTDTKPVLLLGHLSMILDFTLSDCGKYIITCDRDEKIRVSHFPNAYNIVSYCLGHREFVMSIKVYDDLLISASGDGTVRFWNYLQGQQTGLINTNDNIYEKSLLEDFSVQMDAEKVDVCALPITNMQTHKCGTVLYVALSLYNHKGIQLYKTDLNNYASSYICNILPNDNVSSFYLTDTLIVLTNTMLAVYKLTDENYILKKCSKISDFFEKHKTFLSKVDNNPILMLYKRKFDNVQEYLERKKLRLEGRE